MTTSTTTEHDEQAALFRMVAAREGNYPEVGRLFAIPNAGKRSVRAGMWMKAEGLRAGVPDLFLPVMRFCKPEYEMLGGLFIEMKIKGNKPTPQQLLWHGVLREAGYRVAVCYGWQEAWMAICDYLGIPDEVG